ncbi:UNVERIFIED_CONTAM: mannose-6-phosphate isomerase, partial [Prevotella sp. 15_C9]
GGNKIIPFKKLNDNLSMVGESWEISGVKGSECIVTNGKYAGKQLNELSKLLKTKLLGKQNYERFGDEFPLRRKFIDA